MPRRVRTAALRVGDVVSAGACRVLGGAAALGVLAVVLALPRPVSAQRACMRPELQCVTDRRTCLERLEVPAVTSDCAICCETPPAPRPVEPQKPLLVFYGFFRGADGPDLALNQALVRGLAPRAEVVVTTGDPVRFEPGTGTLVDYDFAAPRPASFSEWRGDAVPAAWPSTSPAWEGVKLAKPVTDVTLVEWLDSSDPERAIADRFVKYFLYGWDFVYVDELRASDFRDRASARDRAEADRNERRLRRLERVLQRLDELGFDRRIIFFMNLSSVEVHRRAEVLGQLGSMRGLLRVLGAHARASLYETYPSNSRTCGDRCLTTRRVVRHGSARLLENVARRVRTAAGRSGAEAMRFGGFAIGVANDPGCDRSPSMRSCNYLDLPRCDLSPLHGLCPEARFRRSGGLHAQFVEMGRSRSRAREFRALGFYTPARANDTPAWTRADLASTLNRLASTWVGRRVRR